MHVSQPIDSPPPMPTEQPKTQSGGRKQFLLGLATGVVTTALVATGIGLALNGSDSDRKPSASSSSPAASASGAAEEAAAEETAEEYNTAPSATDFTLKLKTTSKHCFGSAGCNVTVEPDLTYESLTPLDPSAAISITYVIHGDESGPVTETMELTGQTNLRYQPTSISTPGGGTKVTVEITDVEVSTL